MRRNCETASAGNELTRRYFLTELSREEGKREKREKKEKKKKKRKKEKKRKKRAEPRRRGGVRCSGFPLLGGLSNMGEGEIREIQEYI